jgi:hypothetical protein
VFGFPNPFEELKSVLRELAMDIQRGTGDDEIPRIIPSSV